jgi:ribonuclease inhibitor
MRHYVINVTSSSLEDFHEDLRIALGLPEFYGANANALWDCLTGWIETPAVIEWRNFQAVKCSLGDVANYYRDIFKQAAEEVDGLEFRILGDD